MNFTKLLIFIIILQFSVSGLSKSQHSKYQGKERYLISGNNVNLRSKADVNSNIITQLNTGDVVYIIKKSDFTTVISNNNGQWVYVYFIKRDYDIDNSIKEYYGWLFDYFIVYPDHFKKIKNYNNFNKILFLSYGGDYQQEINIKQDGSFSFTITLYGSGNKTAKSNCNLYYKGIWSESKSICELSGYIYRYNNFYWLKLNQLNSECCYIYFTIDKFGIITGCNEYTTSVFSMINSYQNDQYKAIYDK